MLRDDKDVSEEKESLFCAPTLLPAINLSISLGDHDVNAPEAI